MSKVIIDCKDIKTVEDFHKYVKRVFDFPDFYGRNLDALWDLLTERSSLDVKLVNKNFLLANLGDYGNKVISLFEELADENHNYKIRIY